MDCQIPVMDGNAAVRVIRETLTDLPNRSLLNDSLGQVMAASQRNGYFGALMYLDLDNFQPLDDIKGHEVGDVSLIEAAKRLRQSVREVDTVARFSGDEFVMVLCMPPAESGESVTSWPNSTS